MILDFKSFVLNEGDMVFPFFSLIKSKDTHDEIEYCFQTPNCSYIISLLEIGYDDYAESVSDELEAQLIDIVKAKKIQKFYDISFMVEGKPINATINKGEVFKVVGTVAWFVNDYIQKNKNAALIFTGAANDAKRYNLYKQYLTNSNNVNLGYLEYEDERGSKFMLVYKK